MLVAFPDFDLLLRSSRIQFGFLGFIPRYFREENAEETIGNLDRESDRKIVHYHGRKFY
jgi:hypothetical protein